MSEKGQIAPFPSFDVPRTKKSSPEYGFQFSEAIYTRWYNNMTVWGNVRLGWFDTQRLYAEGRQDRTVYQKRFLGTTKDGNTRRGYSNISFDISSSAPKHIGTIHSLVTATDFDVEIGSLSKEATFKKSKMKHELWFDKMIGNPLRQQSAEQLGLDIPLKDHYWMPENRQELELYDKYGGFKLPFETGLSMIVKDAFKTSDWPYVHKRCLDKLLQTSWTIAKIVDNQDGSTGVRFVDTANYICSFVEDDNIESPYEGDFEYVSLQTLVPGLKKAYPNITQEDIESIALMNMSYNSNYTIQNYRTPDPVTQRFPYYDFKIKVFHFTFMAVDTDFYVKEGKKFYKSEYGKRVEKENKKTEEFSNCTRYEGTRIVGLKYVINYGECKNIVKSADGTPESRYIRISTNEISIVERWKPWLDELQMIQLKYRTFVMAMKPNTTVYDLGIMANIDLGNGKLTQAEMVSLEEQTGRMFIQTRGDLLNKVDPRAAIQKLGNPQAGPIADAMNAIAFIEHQIQSAAGITDAVAAQPGASPDRLVGVGQQEMAATSNAMFNLVFTMTRFKEKIAKKLISKTRVKMEFDPKTREYYGGVIGDHLVDAILQYKDLSLNQIGITMKVKASPERKRMIMDLVGQSLAAGRNGQIGINPSDALFVEKELEEGTVEMAMWYLSIAEERAFKKNQEAQLMMQKDNSEKQIAAAQSAAESQSRVMQMKSELDAMSQKQKIADQFMADMKLQQDDNHAKLDQIELAETLRADNQPPKI